MFDHLFQMSDAGVQVFVRQDQDATTKVQRGMHSRFAARGRYSWQEASHVQFNRWLVQRYRRHWPRITAELSITTDTTSDHAVTTENQRTGHRTPGEQHENIEEVHRSSRCTEPRRAACGDDDEESDPLTRRPPVTRAQTRVDGGTVHRSTVDARRRRPKRRARNRRRPKRPHRSISTPTVTARSCSASPPPDHATTAATTRRLSTRSIEVSEENGFEDPIVVDNITTEDAATELANLAEQGVDMIFVGASEIADPLTDLIAQYPDIFWYCNCGAGFPENPGLAQSQDDSSEISYTAGYATGLLLQESGGDNVAFIGCCDLNFEKEAYLAFELGLKAVDDSYTMTYVPTGAFPFDFDNTAGATEAFNGAIDEGADAVYPYLGGAHEPLVKLANEQGLITMSAGSSKACERTDLDYQIAGEVRRWRLHRSDLGGDHRRHVPRG